MIGISLLLFPLALFPTGQYPPSDVIQPPQARLGDPAASAEVGGHGGSAEPPRAVDAAQSAWLSLNDAFRIRPARQVRIEHRVIIRIVPVGRATRPSTLTDAGTSVPIRLVERPMAGCVPVRGIAGVSADRAGRLRLHMRGRQIVTVRFNDECQTDAFYSGFYIEQNRDGLMCPARDVVQSRSGVRCTVGRFNQLVAERAD